MTAQAIGFLGTGSYLPERRVSNEEIAARVPDVTPDWILRKTAIRSRHFAADHEATSDLAAKAVSRALAHAGLPPSRVDPLIVATSTGDFPQPPTASAAVIGAVDAGYGIIDVELGTRGDAEHLIKVPAGGSRSPASARTVADGGHYFTMQGRDVREFVLDNVPPVLAKLLARAGTEVAAIDCFVPHQANGVMLAELVGQCGLADTHTHLVLDRYGNIGSPSVPVALDDAVHAGLIGDGALILLAAFGGGMSVGGALVRWCAPSEGMAK